MLVKKEKLYQPLIISQRDLYINFDKKQYNMIIVTGITGAGKSYTSQELSKKYGFSTIAFDYIYGYEKDREKNELEKEIYEHFYTKYPQYRTIPEKLKRHNEETIDFKRIDNDFFDFVFNYIKKNNIKIIFEGTNFLVNIDYKKIENEHIIIKRTSVVKAMYQRTIRCINRTKNTSSRLIKFLKDIRYTLIHLNKWYNTANNYFRKLELLGVTYE